MATTSLTIAGTKLELETGKIARLANGAVLVRAGDNVLLATVVIGAPREGVDFFPLTVEYREKLAAAGRIPGAFGRREGRITDHEVLVSRLVDRSIRSLFPDGYSNEVQVQVLVFSADPDADLATLAIVGACAALQLSEAPAAGPAAGLRLIKTAQGFTPFPPRSRRGDAELDFVVSAGPNGLVMVEGEAREVGEDVCLQALEQAAEWLARLRKAIGELAAEAGRPKSAAPATVALPAVPPPIAELLRAALRETRKTARASAVDAARTAMLAASEPATHGALSKAFEELRWQLVREAILAEGRRLDGRDVETVREIRGEVGLLPRAHGSALFTRGETQALVTCTLGTAEESLRSEGLSGSEYDHFLLHYNFPPYSVGEIRPLRGPGRREIGHGFLARRGLAPVLPSFDEFPYTIRIESEITESNGSSSMATVCGGCLALMQAGVPITRPVAGIAMGLVTDGTRTSVLTDILGDEDHLGDMDFKVVGTARGVTALQLDNKVGGLDAGQLGKALDQAKRGRLHVLAEMAKVLAAPAPTLAPRAPRVMRTAILPDTIAVLIGPRGQTIKGIASATKAQVNVDDDGIVRIYAAEEAVARKALRMVGKVAGVVRRGGYYTGTITRVESFGVFVRINEVVEGLVGRDELFANRREPDREFNQGDEVVVRVVGVDSRGRLDLSLRAAIDVDREQTVVVRIAGRSPHDAELAGRELHALEFVDLHEGDAAVLQLEEPRRAAPHALHLGREDLFAGGALGLRLALRGDRGFALRILDAFGLAELHELLLARGALGLDALATDGGLVHALFVREAACVLVRQDLRLLELVAEVAHRRGMVSTAAVFRRQSTKRTAMPKRPAPNDSMRTISAVFGAGSPSTRTTTRGLPSATK
ncbi:MAG: polyribonucleotide nucleotidyltransferase [Planctomycetes bacterium]|nr:polyribonucleotide nucleotidyltransferase [Planctomycetota bacterium]